jgi:hypothetical protein
MGKRLAVIFGAGASHDCASIGVTPVNHEYRPPLVSGIFSTWPPFQKILQKYPKARTLASTIAVRVNQGNPLEAVLRDLRDSEESHIVRQFRQIPLYLQELFGEISIHYTSEAVNYTYLVNRLLYSDFERVAFVTLNYDLFLERSIGTILSRTGAAWKPEHLSFYEEPNRKWMLIKLHGSANWGRLLARRQMKGTWTHEQMLDEVESLAFPLEKVLARDITVLASHQERSIKKAGMSDLYYPAISVPVDGKYEFVCPENHIEALRDFLSSCENYLLIGVSGRDRDLTDFLKMHVGNCATLGIVEGDPKAAEEVAGRFYGTVHQFAKANVKKVYNQGFGEFTKVRGNSLDEFLKFLKD